MTNAKVQPKTLEMKPTQSKASFTSFLTNLSLEDKIGMLLLGLILLLAYTIRIKFLDIPFERDEGAYTYYGKMLNMGKIPYKDFYEQKLPGIFYFYAWVIRFFGDSVSQLHQGFILINLLSTTFLYLAARNLFSATAGVVAALTFIVLSMNPFMNGFTIQSEHGVDLFTCLGLWVFTYTIRYQNKWLYLLVGLIFGMAFMTKTSGLFIVAAGGFMLLINDIYAKRKFLEIIVNGLLYVVGVGLVVGLFFLMIQSKGSFKEMLFWVVEIPKNYVEDVK